MGLMLDEDEFTKIPVVGDEKAPFPVGDGENFLIWQTRGVVEDDGSNVVTLQA